MAAKTPRRRRRAAGAGLAGERFGQPLSDILQMTRDWTVKADIPRMTPGLAGNLPLSCSSGKPDSLARDQKTGWDEPSNLAIFHDRPGIVIKAHLSREFCSNA